ncbi:hypothetical protein AAK967_00695 [Atopobiaceae bacterium 24-176]
MPTRSPLRDRWRRWRASGIPLCVCLEWAVSDFCTCHRRLAALAALALLCAAVWAAVGLLMDAAHPTKGALS